jgi:minor extracellular serine protease Vpr
MVTLSNPIHGGDRLVIYATGLGRTIPFIDAGLPAPSDPPAVLVTPPDISLGGVTLPIDFAGLAPGEVGVYQINVQVPRSVPDGMEIPLTIRQGSGATTVSVRVVN